jgi:hypothetical protein
MTLSEFKRISLHDWEVETLRASNFLASNANVNAEKWWQSVVGAEPETEVVKSKVGEKVQQGPFGDTAQLTLRLQPTRIDWLLSPTVQEQRTAGISSVGRFDEICPRFVELVDRWFSLSPPLSRIAFGAIVMFPVVDLVQGYRQLQEYLPVLKIDPEGSSDLLYRINRKRDSQSGIKDLKINRLISWVVASIEYRALEVFPGHTAVAAPSAQTFACRVEMDVNTGAEFSGQFSPVQSPVVFKELVQLGYEIVEKGDVP